MPSSSRGGAPAAVVATVVALTAVAVVAISPPALATHQGYVPGIDVSHWQETIDWNAVAGSGVRFAIVKATEGRTFVDDRYETNRAGATSAGVAFTAYHFARPDTSAGDAVAEADHFVNVAGLLPGYIVPALDLEVGGGLGVNGLKTWTMNWLERVRQRLGVRAMIYTSPNFWKTRLGDTTEFAAAGYKVLWIAHWTSNEEPTVPAGNWGGHGWTFWQWTSCWSVPGIAGCVDGDRYNGTDLAGALMRELSVTPTAGGSVTGEGVSCGTAGTVCERLTDPLSTVVLTATPNPDATFLGWEGACSGTATCTLTMDTDKSVGAVFGFTVSTSMVGTGKGSIASSLPGIDCGAACQADYRSGTVVMLTATPQIGSAFGGWSGACTGTSACQLTVDGDRDVVATFIDVAPKVAVATPDSLTEPIGALFNEPVRNVTPSNVVLRVTGTTVDQPATVSCRDVVANQVDCMSGEVRSAALQPMVPLLPGQRYSVVLNPAGVSPAIADPEGNPLATGTTKKFRAARTVQESGHWTGYSWSKVKAQKAFGGSYLRERLAGAEVSFAFAGTFVTWHTLRAPDQGLASVFVDGTLQGTFSQYAANPRYRVARTFGDFTPGDHVITIRVVGKKGDPAATGTFVGVDGFSVDAGAVVETPPVDASWRRVGSGQASGGGYVTSGLFGATATFRFRGTGVHWYTVTGPNQGVARAYVDGVLKGTFDNYSSTMTFGVRRTLRNLPDRVHTLKIVAAGTRSALSKDTLVAVDRFVAI